MTEPALELRAPSASARPAQAGSGPSAAAEPGAVAARSVSVLRRRKNFLDAARGRKWSAPGFLLQARRRDPAEPADADVRIGFTASKKVGNAVARNRAKRRLRALAHETLPALGRAGWDYVLVARAEATATRNFAQMLAELRQALERVHGDRAGGGAGRPRGARPEGGGGATPRGRKGR